MLNLLRKLVVTLKYTPNLEKSTKYENTSVCASKNVTTFKRADLYSLMTCLVWRISKGWAAFTMLSSICSLLLHSLPLCSAVGGVRKAKHTAFLLSHLGEQK